MFYFKEYKFLKGDFMSREKDDPISDSHQTLSYSKSDELELLQQITDIVAEYKAYRAPLINSNGDITISLNPDIKRNMKVVQSLTDAVQFMMNRDKTERSK